MRRRAVDLLVFVIVLAVGVRKKFLLWVVKMFWVVSNRNFNLNRFEK